MPKGTRVSRCVEKVKKLKESLRSLQEKQAAKRVNPGEGDKAGSSYSDEYVSGGRTGKPTIQGRLTGIHTKKASPSAGVRVKNYTAGPKGKLPEGTEMNYKNAYVIKLMEAGKDPRKAGWTAAQREQEKQAAQGTGVDNPKTFSAYKRARIKAGGKHREAGGVPATETPQQKAALGAEDAKKRSGQ